MVDAVNAENRVGYAGHNDRRIPNINELPTLVNYGMVSVSADAVFNNETSSSTGQYYWSSTTYAVSPSNYAWVVYFHGGWTLLNLKNTTIAVRTVRSGS